MTITSWLKQVRQLVSGYTGPAKEGHLLACLRDASPDELIALSGDTRLTHDLVASVERHRQPLLDWAGTTLPNLPPANRGSWLPALTLAGQAGRQTATNLLLGATDDLRALLDGVDALGDHRDLEWLVYTRLDGAQRDAVLAHIAQQGESWPEAVRVISDVDDTVVATFVDPLYPSGTVYPGVLALLERCGHGAPVTIVTARPEGQAGFLEDHLRRMLAARSVATATVLSGRLRNLLGYNAMATRKVINIEHMTQLHPKDNFVLFGDTRQGDIQLAHRAVEAWPGRVLGVFIHELAQPRPPDHQDSRRVTFFDTYIDAAATAVNWGLLTTGDLDAVVAEARQDLAGVAFRNAANAQAAQVSLQVSINELPDRLMRSL